MAEIQQPRKTYLERLEEMERRFREEFNAGGMAAEWLVRQQIMNEVEEMSATGLDIARRNAKIMRQDMAKYQQDNTKFTRSLGAASGFVAQQYMIAAKKELGNLDGVCLYGSGWQWAALSSEVSPQPDVSGHPWITVPKKIGEIYRFLQQADRVELQDIFKAIDKAKAAGAQPEELEKLYAQIDNYDSYIRPMIADIDAGFGDSATTYKMACEMIKAGACCIQIENQDSQSKQCGHQDGKVTVTREEYLAKIRAVRLAFESMGVPEGVIVARTDSLAAGLTKDIAPGNSPYAHDYNKWLDMKEITPDNPAKEGEVLFQFEGKTMRVNRLENGLYTFKKGTGPDRVVEDAIFAMKVGGADLIWIETGKADLREISGLAARIKQEIPGLMLAYNNSPSFAWTLNSRQMILNEWIEKEDPRITEYPDVKDPTLASEKYDNTDLGRAASDYIRHFQDNVATQACVFHNLITLPEFHLVGKGAQLLARDYFGGKGMAAYVSQVQDPEFRNGLSVVKHQHTSGSDLTDQLKLITVGTGANIAAGHGKTENQFDAVLRGDVKKDEPAIDQQRIKTG